MEGSGRILTLFCAEKHQKLVTPRSRRRQGPLSAGWESCGGSGLGGGLPGRAWCEGGGPRPQGRAESWKPAAAPLPQLELPSGPLRPELLAQASVTSSQKSHFSCGRSQNSSTNGLGLGHAVGSPEPSRGAQDKRSALLPGSGGLPATPSALVQGLRWRARS